MRQTILLVVLICTAVCAGAAPVDGGWIGWAYLGEGGDLPLRVWLSSGPRGPVARFDGVPWKAFGWPAEFSFQGDRAVLTLKTPKGSPIRLDGTWTPDRWAGEAHMFGFSGEFELLHAPDLAPVDPDRYADLAGFYRMSDGDVLEARRLAWGEIVVRSIRTGEQRTLLPTGEDAFMTGPGRYVPTPVETHYRLVRGRKGAVRELIRRPVGGKETRGSAFSLRENDVRVDNDGVILAATVTRPDDDRARAGVVLLGGSSWETRADHAFQVRNLAALGFTVIHWDKRGFGESGGSNPAPFAKTAADAVAAAELLRCRTDVTRVGYLGMSRGGWTGPLAVSMDHEAAFLVLLVPPATTPAVQEQGARLARMGRDGHDEADIELASRLLDAAWRFLESGGDESWERYAGLYREARKRGVPEYVYPPATRDREQWRWGRMNMLFDPQPVLRQIQIPVLAVFAQNDLNVLSRIHRPLMHEAFETAGNDDVTLVTVPDVSHSLARTREGPHHRSRGVGPEGFDVIMGWAARQGLP